jgi:hypothetical protein
MTAPSPAHQPVVTLADLLALDGDEVVAGHLSAEKGDPEPGMNHTRAFHHGWRTRMMDLHEIETPPEHRALVRAFMNHLRSLLLEAPHG